MINIIKYKNIIILSLFTFFFIKFIKYIKIKYIKTKNPIVIFIISFIILIIIGTLILMFTNSTKNKILFIDALFTATSAVCVTGLTVLEISKEFTFFGKLVIMFLIELGGLGILTITSFFVSFFKDSTSLKKGIYMNNLLNSDSLNNVMNLTVKIVLITIIIELIGAILIYNSIKNTYLEEENLIFFSIFHSISAFCNAGFSTISNGGLYNINLRYNYKLHLIISFLIILGGLGFNILFNIYKYIKIKIKEYIYKFKNKNIKNKVNILTLNTNIVITTTSILLLLGTLFYYIFEFNKSLIEHKSIYSKIITSFFCSTTLRTAGFQTINLESLSSATILFSIILMWIGASPNSTGGGIKTTTFTLLILNVFSLAKNKKYLEIKKREIPSMLIKKAFAITTLSLFITLISIIILLICEPKEDVIKISFEVLSAISTVGLSLGITPNLSFMSKIILIILMLIGRIGSFNIIIGVMKKVIIQYYKYPKESILIN